MKFFATATLLSLVGLVSSARICAEADRFGDPVITPSQGLHVGSTITINVDLTCSIHFGFNITSLDYLIDIPANLNNSVAQQVLLGHHIIAPGAVSDSLTTKIPNAHFISGKTYNFELVNHFINEGVATSGGILSPITFA